MKVIVSYSHCPILSTFRMYRSVSLTYFFILPYRSLRFLQQLSPYTLLRKNTHPTVFTMHCPVAFAFLNTFHIFCCVKSLHWAPAKPLRNSSRQCDDFGLLVGVRAAGCTT